MKLCQLKLHFLCLVVVVGVTGIAGADELLQSFKDGKFDETKLRLIGSADRVSREPDGLRIALEKESGSSANSGISFPMQVVGDFSIQAAVHVKHLPQPGGGYGTGVAILVEDGIAHGASLQRVKMPDGKEHFVAHKFVKDESGTYKHEAKTFPVTTTEVVLRIERQGGELTYQVSEDQGSSFRTLTKLPFTADPLKVAQVYGQAGGEPNTVEAVIHEFRLEGEKFIRPGQKPPPRGSNLYWLAGVLFVLIPLLGGGIWWYRRP